MGPPEAPTGSLGAPPEGGVTASLLLSGFSGAKPPKGQSPRGLGGREALLPHPHVTASLLLSGFTGGREASLPHGPPQGEVPKGQSPGSLGVRGPTGYPVDWVPVGRSEFLKKDCIKGRHIQPRLFGKKTLIFSKRSLYKGSPGVLKVSKALLEPLGTLKKDVVSPGSFAPRLSADSKTQIFFISNRIQKFPLFINPSFSSLSLWKSNKTLLCNKQKKTLQSIEKSPNSDVLVLSNLPFLIENIKSQRNILYKDKDKDKDKDKNKIQEYLKNKSLESEAPGVLIGRLAGGVGEQSSPYPWQSHPQRGPVGGTPKQDFLKKNLQWPREDSTDKFNEIFISRKSINIGAFFLISQSSNNLTPWGEAPKPPGEALREEEKLRFSTSRKPWQLAATWVPPLRGGTGEARVFRGSSAPPRSEASLPPKPLGKAQPPPSVGAKGGPKGSVGSFAPRTPSYAAGGAPAPKPPGQISRPGGLGGRGASLPNTPGPVGVYEFVGRRELLDQKLEKHLFSYDSLSYYDLFLYYNIHKQMSSILCSYLEKTLGQKYTKKHIFSYNVLRRLYNINIDKEGLVPVKESVEPPRGASPHEASLPFPLNPVGSAQPPLYKTVGERGGPKGGFGASPRAPLGGQSPRLGELCSPHPPHLLKPALIKIKKRAVLIKSEDQAPVPFYTKWYDLFPYIFENPCYSITYNYKLNFNSITPLPLDNHKKSGDFKSRVPGKALKPLGGPEGGERGLWEKEKTRGQTSTTQIFYSSSKIFQTSQIFAKTTYRSPFKGEIVSFQKNIFRKSSINTHAKDQLPLTNTLIKKRRGAKLPGASNCMFLTKNDLTSYYFEKNKETGVGEQSSPNGDPTPVAPLPPTFGAPPFAPTSGAPPEGGGDSFAVRVYGGEAPSRAKPRGFRGFAPPLLRFYILYPLPTFTSPTQRVGDEVEQGARPALEI